MNVDRKQRLKRIQEQHMLDSLDLLILFSQFQTVRQHFMPVRNQIRNDGASILRPRGQYLMSVSHTN